MASFHISIKTGKKGGAARHSRYINREGQFARPPEGSDLVASGFGNLPCWTNGVPGVFWNAADKYERSNAAVYREYELALPEELTVEQNDQLVRSFITENFMSKPFQYAIHRPIAALGGVPQPHAHIMISERLEDEHYRDATQHFRRYNPVNPDRGGCRKDNCGRAPEVASAHASMQRRRWADKQNQYLEAHGHQARVDHRSHSERGLACAPAQHLGQAAVRRMLSTRG